jgi:hypothetical protein
MARKRLGMSTRAPQDHVGLKASLLSGELAGWTEMKIQFSHLEPGKKYHVAACNSRFDVAVRRSRWRAYFANAMPDCGRFLPTSGRMPSFGAFRTMFGGKESLLIQSLAA